MFSRRLMSVAMAASFSSATRAGPITIHELVSDFSWGYRCGVKQPVGAFKDGLSVHQITKSNFPRALPPMGNPDYLFWVDEIAGTRGVSELPTDPVHDYAENPGGMVSFGADGTIWYTYGARAQDLPLHLFSSLQPYGTTAFFTHLGDIDPTPGSTTPCVNVHGPKLMFFYRHANSASLDVSVRFKRYDLNMGFGSPEIELELGHGGDHVQLGNVGIEQLWTRSDPRFDYTFVTWQYFSPVLQTFGSDPFLYTDDDGATWRTADGAAWTRFPILYSEITDVLVPFDHLAAGRSSWWLVNDLGVSPNGVFWMTVRDLFVATVEFWFFNAGAGIWESRPLADIQDCKPFACGVTEDDIVFVYSDIGSEHILKARFSADDGDTWSDPIHLDVLDPSQRISWVSFVQPADRYVGNSARFFYGYTQFAGSNGLRYQNNIRWIRFDLDAISADLDGDGTVGIADLLMLLAAWGPCGSPCPPACPGDIDGDCTVGITDMLSLLANWD